MAIKDAYEKFLNADLFYTQEEIAKQYGESVKKSISSSLVLKDEEVFLGYKEKNLITINEEENKQISKALIQDLLNNEGMYKYLQTNLDNKLGIAARIDFIIDEYSIASIKLTRKEFINALNLLSSELNQKAQMRSAIIKSSWGLFSCEQRYRNYNHRAFINDTYLDIPAPILLRLLSCTDKEFEMFIKGDLNFGYAKEVLAYALVDFVERERILIKYVLPDAVVTRYKNIKNYSLIDFESLNKNRIRNDINTNGESIIDKIKISDELRTYLDSEINPEYSNLEKAVHYYIKLLEIFSLDENYYLGKSLNLLEEHESIENINAKKPKDKVAMYDFLTIYASLLAELKLDLTLSQSLMAGDDLGNAMLTFKYGEYLIAINSLATPEKSDFTNAKVSEPITNIVSINKNKTTKKKFDELVAKVYKNINDKKENKRIFDTALNSYRKNVNKKIPIKDKIYILLKEIIRTDLKGMDMVGYEKKIFHQLFANNKDITLNILAKYNSETNYLTPVSIISIRDEYYQYIVVDETSKEVLKTITIDELTSLLCELTYYYVDNDRIPGLSRYVGDKFVR